MPVRPVFPGEGSGSVTGVVNSVNGEQGDVIITAQDVNAQPVSSVLTDIAAITMPDNSFLHTDGSGNFTPSLCMPAGVAWLSYTTVDQQKDHLALSEVASSGDYNDLSNKPAIFSGSYADLTGKPVLFSGNYADLTNKPTSFPPAAHTHTIADVTGLQSNLDSKLNVGSSIPYSSLTGAPTIPSAQVSSDWNSTSGVSQILNKPVLFDGTYSSLTGKPTSFTPSVHTHAINDITGLQTALDGKVSTGSSIPYSVLTGTPVIPAAQIQSDWNQTNIASLDFIKNKPTIPTVSYPVTSVNTKTGAVVLTNTDVGAAATSHTHAISDVTGLQASLDSKATTTSLSGYVTNSALTTSLSGYATTTALTNGLSAKFNTPVGSTNQYVRGDGTLATFPVIPTVPTNVSAFTNDSGYLTNAVLTGYRKVETFLGTSDASGNITITFANTYSTPPDVQPQIIGGTFNQSVRVVSVSTTGCVVQAAQRNVVTLLSVEVLLGATVNLAGASVTIQVTPRS